MISSFFNAISTLVDTVLPIYHTAKVLRQRRTTLLVPISKYWCVYAFLRVVETIFFGMGLDFFVPGYSFLRIFAVIYIYLTGYEHIYASVINTGLQRYEARVLDFCFTYVMAATARVGGALQTFLLQSVLTIFWPKELRPAAVEPVDHDDDDDDDYDEDEYRYALMTYSRDETVPITDEIPTRRRNESATRYGRAAGGDYCDALRGGIFDDDESDFSHSSNADDDDNADDVEEYPPPARPVAEYQPNVFRASTPLAAAAGASSVAPTTSASAQTNNETRDNSDEWEIDPESEPTSTFAKIVERENESREGGPCTRTRSRTRVQRPSPTSSKQHRRK